MQGYTPYSIYPNKPVIAIISDRNADEAAKSLPGLNNAKNIAEVLQKLYPDVTFIAVHAIDGEIEQAAKNRRQWKENRDSKKWSRFLAPFCPSERNNSRPANNRYEPELPYNLDGMIFLPGHYSDGSPPHSSLSMLHTSAMIAEECYRHSLNKKCPFMLLMPDDAYHWTRGAREDFFKILDRKVKYEGRRAIPQRHPYTQNMPEGFNAKDVLECLDDKQTHDAYFRPQKNAWDDLLKPVFEHSPIANAMGFAEANKASAPDSEDPPVSADKSRSENIYFEMKTDDLHLLYIRDLFNVLQTQIIDKITEAHRNILEKQSASATEGPKQRPIFSDMSLYEKARIQSLNIDDCVTHWWSKKSTDKIARTELVKLQNQIERIFEDQIRSDANGGRDNNAQQKATALYPSPHTSEEDFTTGAEEVASMAARVAMAALRNTDVSYSHVIPRFNYDDPRAVSYSLLINNFKKALLQQAGLKEQESLAR